jgi:hypothetical protein
MVYYIRDENMSIWELRMKRSDMQMMEREDKWLNRKKNQENYPFRIHIEDMWLDIFFLKTCVGQKIFEETIHSNVSLNKMFFI